MSSTGEPGTPTVRVSPQVIDPGELDARIQELLSAVDTTDLDLDPPPRRVSRHPYLEAGLRAERLHQLWGTVVTPGLSAARGLGGSARRVVQRLTRRGTRWYVEPRWDTQREIDEEMARFATDTVQSMRRTYIELCDARREIDELGRVLDSQRRALARLRDELLKTFAFERASAVEVGKLRDETVQLMTRLGVSSAHGADFDYVAFADRFRGDSTTLRAMQADYVTKFPGPSEPGAVVDVGCGRGEMLEALRAAGHEIIGIDLDENMVAVCHAKGLPVVRGDGTRWLEGCEPGTLKGVFSAQVIEHLLTPELERFLRASMTCLRHGGVLVTETINPRSLHALANHFFADLSHVRPIHPETLRFMCEQAGFSDVALMELSPHPAVAEAARLGDEAVDTTVRQLVDSVFGCQDYAIVATKLDR